jgi:hypothetical protein
MLRTRCVVFKPVLKNPYKVEGEKKYRENNPALPSVGTLNYFQHLARRLYELP